MLCATLHRQLRQIILSRPVVFASHHQSIQYSILFSNTSRHISNPNPSPNVTTQPSCCVNSTNIKSRLTTTKQLNIDSLHKSSLHSHTNFSTNLLSKRPNSFHHCHNEYNGINHFTPTCSIHNITSSKQGHILSIHKTQPVPHALLGFPHHVLHTKTPGETEYTRGAINIPKLILDASPTSVQPYLQMMRLDRPIGTWLLYWPCTWSIALAAQPGHWPDFYMLALFGAGAFFMRGSGCIINDMWDKDFDNKVERTRGRPLASGRVSYPQALVFLSSQLAISLAILMQLNWYSICLGAASLGIVITYPAFKRFTYWPQIVLGFAFNYGALLGWAAVRGSCDWSICLPLYFLCHMWTMVYDTIYAHQDKTDDLAIGVKSTALRFGDNTKVWLGSFTTLMAGGLLYVGHMTDMTWPFYTGAAITISSIVTQLYRLDIDNPQACGDAFRFHFYMGLLMFVSIVAGTLAKPKEGEGEGKVEHLEEASSLVI